MGLSEALRADVSANIERPASTRDLVVQILTARGVQALLLYRLAHAAAHAGIPLVPSVLTRLVQLIFTVDISPHAVIGPGATLRHCQGVVIGYQAVIGARCKIFHQVTVGKRYSGSTERPDGMAVIGEDVTLGAGAKVLGPVTIGDAAVIGANAVVTRDVPAGGLAVGNNDISPSASGGDQVVP